MRQLGIFAKYWQAGEVKTRLAQSVGEKAAARFYECSLRHLLARFASQGDRRVLAYTPESRLSAFQSIAATAWHLESQQGGDLGDRMRNFFEGALESGADRTVLIGSDSPTLPVAFVEQAFTQLAEHRVVVGPSDDGGYYLIGIAGEPPPIFEGIAWSTAHVWQQTIARLIAENWDYAVLPEWYDVDDLRGLLRLGEELDEASLETAKDELSRAVAEALVEAARRGMR